MVLLSLVLHACITFTLLSNKELDTFYGEYSVSYPLIINGSVKNNHRILWVEKDFTHFYVCESMDMDMVLKMSVDLSYTI